ncbi:MAG: CDP-alcohol phosphatidyltransferase family protein [Oscillospiraceae bacterium]
MKLQAREFFSIPNILSYVRIALIPLFVYKIITAVDYQDYYFAAAIILLSGLTDFADGLIARKFNQITQVGKVLDPVADKLTQVCILLSLMFKIKYMFILVILLVVKELFMGISCLFLLTRDRKLDGAKWFGKVSTAVFYFVMCIILAFPMIIGTVYVNILMIISAAFLLLSFVMYAREFFRMYLSTKEPQKNDEK